MQSQWLVIIIVIVVISELLLSMQSQWPVIITVVISELYCQCKVSGWFFFFFFFLFLLLLLLLLLFQSYIINAKSVDGYYYLRAVVLNLWLFQGVG